jgi:sugar phosphate isomerase/epimerase
VHPRLTVHDHVFARDASLATVLDGCARAGARRIGLARGRLETEGWKAGIRAVRDSGLDVTHVVHGPLFALEDPASWAGSAARVVRTLDTAAELGARCVYGVTGPAISLTWEQAAEAFARAAEPVAAHARGCGIPLLIEPTNMLFANVGFVHTLRDTVDVARRAGLRVCMDVQHCWTERGLRETIHEAAGAIALVQLSDYIPGRREPFRAVPGDGAIPLKRIVAWVLDSGYGGLFDLELYAEPGVDPADTIARALAVTGALVEDAGGAPAMVSDRGAAARGGA